MLKSIYSLHTLICSSSCHRYRDYFKLSMTSSLNWFNRPFNWHPLQKGKASKPGPHSTPLISWDLSDWVETIRVLSTTLRMILHCLYRPFWVSHEFSISTLDPYPLFWSRFELKPFQHPCPLLAWKTLMTLLVKILSMILHPHIPLFQGPPPPPSSRWLGELFSHIIPSFYMPLSFLTF